MKTPRTLALISAALALAGVFTFSGCASDYDGGLGSSDVDFHGSFYVGTGYGPGFYGAPMYGPGYYPPPVVVTPPPVRPPGGGARPMPPMPRPTPRR